MQEQQFNLPRTKCANAACGKIIPKRDTRDTKPQFCSRVCAGIAKFAPRYEGSMSGPFDRPVDIMTKTKWAGARVDQLGSDIPTGA